MPKTHTDTLSIADRLRPVLLQVGRELRREAREVGVSPEQVSLLVAIKYKPGIGIRELAARERVSAPALSNHIDRLERDGLVSRTPDTADRRRVGLTLTDEGQRVLRRGLSPEELDAVEAAIEPLSRLLREDERP
jgi:DNA-binding MarR family transcriptional regulator